MNAGVKTHLQLAHLSQVGGAPTVEAYRAHVPALAKILRSLLMAGFAPEHDVGGVTNPFLQSKARPRRSPALSSPGRAPGLPKQATVGRHTRRRALTSALEAVHATGRQAQAKKGRWYGGGCKAGPQASLAL